MKTGKRMAPVTACEKCDQPAKRKDLTRWRGKWRCDRCLNGNILPISISVIQSNMCAWDGEESLDHGNEMDETGNKIGKLNV